MVIQILLLLSLIFIDQSLGVDPSQQCHKVGLLVMVRKVHPIYVIDLYSDQVYI